MRPHLSSLEGQTFDVAVIGAGVNGASAAQHLAARGYKILLVDKGDFASGSSGRSSRILHCGLRYLAPGGSMLDFVLHPTRLATGIRMARLAMEARAQLVATAPERVVATRCHFPIYRDGPYPAWQVAAALKLLSTLGPRSHPLDHRIVAPAEIAKTPLVRWLRDPDRLSGVATYREYQFEWPERICIDAIFDAERMGGVIRNYTEVTRLARKDDGTWVLSLADRRKDGGSAEVRAKLVLNTAGIWIDRVNATANATARQRITGTKGCHIMVRLPPDCAGYGIATFNRLKEPLYCLPWRGMHYFGPTETLYEGDIDAIRVEDKEVEFLLAEANHLLPSLRLKRSDVLYTWAGVRPLTYDPTLPKGNRSRIIHDLALDGMPGVFALTAGPIMTHRSAGRDLTEAVARRLAPSQPPLELSYAARAYPESQNSPPLLDGDPSVRLSDLRHAVLHEQATDLIDILIRRTGAGHTATMAFDAADRAARAVADILGWDEAQIEAEVARYRRYLEQTHRYGRRSSAAAEV